MMGLCVLCFFLRWWLGNKFGQCTERVREELRTMLERWRERRVEVESKLQSLEKNWNFDFSLTSQALFSRFRKQKECNRKRKTKKRKNEKLSNFSFVVLFYNNFRSIFHLIVLILFSLSPNLNPDTFY